MKTVWKFTLKVEDWQTIKMPAGARAIHVGQQNGFPVLWAIVDSNNPPIDRTFRITGTGHLVEPELAHIGSVQVPLGSMSKGDVVSELVWHVWEPV